MQKYLTIFLALISINSFAGVYDDIGKEIDDIDVQVQRIEDRNEADFQRQQDVRRQEDAIEDQNRRIEEMQEQHRLDDARRDTRNRVLYGR